MKTRTYNNELLLDQNIKLCYNDYLWERNRELHRNEYVWKRNIELRKLNNLSSKYSQKKGRWRVLITGINQTIGDYFIPDKNIYLNMENLESKKEYIYLFLVYNEEIHSQKFPLQNEEKELILFHFQNEICDQIFIIDCFKWASYFNLIDEKEIFFNRITNFSLDLVVYLCKTNDEFYFKKLLNHPNFTNDSDIFRLPLVVLSQHVCAYSNKFSIIKLLIDKKFDNQQIMIDNGIKILIRLGNTHIARELIEYTSRNMTDFFRYAIKYFAFDFIYISFDIDENSKIDFAKKMIYVIIKNEYIDTIFIRIFATIIKNDNFFKTLFYDFAIDNSDLLKIILCIMQFDIFTCNLLAKLINLSSNTIQDYNEVFKKILKYDIDSIINIYEIIPIEFNEMNSTTKQMYIEYIENKNFDHTYRGKYENILKLINIIRDLNYITRKKITKDILEYLFYKVDLGTLNIKIQILKYLIRNNSWIMKLIEDKQEEIYSNNCGDKNFKIWFINFPIASDKLINVLKKLSYMPKNIPIRNILGDKYITFIYNEMIRIVNSKFILLDQIHALGTNIDINEKECIELIENISNYELDDNINTNLFVCILKLRFYNFSIEINNNSFLADLQRKIIYDWCMRQYIVHNLNATIIWRCIFNFFTIEEKYILFFDFAKKDLNKDIVLNICLITQLMNFWENKK